MSENKYTGETIRAAVGIQAIKTGEQLKKAVILGDIKNAKKLDNKEIQLLKIATSGLIVDHDSSSSS